MRPQVPFHAITLSLSPAPLSLILASAWLSRASVHISSFMLSQSSAYLRTHATHALKEAEQATHTHRHTHTHALKEAEQATASPAL